MDNEPLETVKVLDPDGSHRIINKSDLTSEDVLFDQPESTELIDVRTMGDELPVYVPRRGRPPKVKE